LQSRGYKFAASPENYGHLRIVKEGDFVNLQCSEGMENIEREPTAADKRKPSWTWELKQTTPTGRLSFEIHARGLRGRRTWTEAGHKPLPEILGILVEKIEASFSGFENERRRQVEFEKQRKENERRWAEERAEEERRRLKRERQQKHESKLAAIAESRQQNLLTAARQWVEFYNLRAFIDHCESRWRETAGGQVTPDQIDWLQWARAEMVRLNPFAKGYPDPAIDGGFDPKSIPVGGPYPQTKTLEEQKVVEPAGESFQATSVHPQASQPPEPFPFWLLHRKH